MDESKIRQIFREEIESYMSQKQFSNSKIPVHEHNGQDTKKIPVSSLIDSIPINGDSGGVFNKTILGNQTVNRLYGSSSINPQTVYTLPVPMVYGFGVGVDSAFNGGLAGEATMVAFSNGALSTLWFMMDGTWRGVSLDLSA